MIHLAPNVYVLGYLSATKQLSGASEANAYKFIQSGTSRLHPQYSDSEELFFEIVTGSVYKSFYERAPKFFFLPPPPPHFTTCVPGFEYPRYHDWLTK